MGYITKKAPEPIIMAKDTNLYIGEIDGVPGNSNTTLINAGAFVSLDKSVAIDGIAILFSNYNNTGNSQLKEYSAIGSVLFDEFDLFAESPTGTDNSILVTISKLLSDAYLIEHYDVQIAMNNTTANVEILITAKELGSVWQIELRSFDNTTTIGTHETAIDEPMATGYIDVQLMHKLPEFEVVDNGGNPVSYKRMLTKMISKLKAFLDNAFCYIINLQDVKKVLKPHVLHYINTIGALMPYRYDAHAMLLAKQNYVSDAANFLIEETDFTQSPYPIIPEGSDWVIDIPPLPIGTLSPIRSSFLLQNSQRTWLYVIYDDADANVTSTLFDSLALGIRVIRIKYDANASILRTRIVSALADFSTEIGVPVWDWGTGVMMAGMPAGIGFEYWNMNANINTPNPATYQLKHFIDNLIWSPISKKMMWLNFPKYYKNFWEGNGSYFTVNHIDLSGMENKVLQVELKYTNTNSFDLEIRVAIKIDGWFLGTSQWYTMPANSSGTIIHTRLMPASYSPSNLHFSAGVGQIELIPNDPAPGNLHLAPELSFTIDDIELQEVNNGKLDCYDVYLGGLPYFEQPKLNTTTLFASNNKRILSNRPLTITLNALLYLTDIVYDKTKHASFGTLEKTYYFGNGMSTTISVALSQFAMQNTSTAFVLEDAEYWMDTYGQVPYKITIQYKNLDRGDAGYNGIFPPSTTTTAITSQLYTILIDHKPRHTNNYFRFFNALGGNDFAWCDGKLEVMSKIDAELYEVPERGKGDYWREFGIGRDSINIEERYKLSTGYKTKTEIEWLKELMSSELVHWYTEAQLLQTIRNRHTNTMPTECYYIVVIDSDSIDIHDGEHGLQAIEFEFRLAVNSQVPHYHLGSANHKMPLVLQDLEDSKYKII